jgi:hypothetical protein
MTRVRVGTGSATRRALAALLVLGALAPLGARAQTPPAPDASAPAPDAEPPELPDLSRDAEAVAARLRQLRESLNDQSAIEALEAEVGGLSRKITDRWNETTEVLKGQPRRLRLDSLASSWSALRESLQTTASRVEARAKRRDADLASLGQLHEAWTKALDAAEKGNAPSSVVERVRATLASIDAVKPLVEQRRTRLLVLEDGVSRSMQACDDALERIHDARREAVERIFSSHRAPVWEAAAGPREADTSARARLFVRTTFEVLRIYVSEYRVGMALSGLLALVLIGLMRRARSEAASLAERDAFFASAASVFETPISAGILLALVLSRPLRPNPPVALGQISLAIAMIGAVVLLRRAVSPSLRRAAYALAALFLLDLASQTLASTLPGVEQGVSMVEKSATAGLLAWIAWHLRDPATVPSWSPRRRSAVHAILYLLALACLVAAGAAALGYLDFADFLGGGTLFLLYTAFGLLAFRQAAVGLVALALVKQPLSRLHATASSSNAASAPCSIWWWSGSGCGCRSTGSSCSGRRARSSTARWERGSTSATSIWPSAGCSASPPSWSRPTSSRA